MGVGNMDHHNTYHIMMDHRKAYLVLFNAVTTAIRTIEKSFVVTLNMTDGLACLREAQREAEALYMEDN